MLNWFFNFVMDLSVISICCGATYCQKFDISYYKQLSCTPIQIVFLFTCLWPFFLCLLQLRPCEKSRVKKKQIKIFNNSLISLLLTLLTLKKLNFQFLSLFRLDLMSLFRFSDHTSLSTTILNIARSTQHFSLSLVIGNDFFALTIYSQMCFIVTCLPTPVCHARKTKYTKEPWH